MSVCVLGAAGEAMQAAAADMRVMLAASTIPFGRIAAMFATPQAQAARKIVALVSDGHIALPLFDIADMLIFSAAAFVEALGLADVPQDVDALLPVQAMLKRPNQAAVVLFAGKGAAAVWADRTLFVPADTAPAMADFAATIAAAVDQGIGPQPALEMALA